MDQQTIFQHAMLLPCTVVMHDVH